MLLLDGVKQAVRGNRKPSNFSKSVAGPVSSSSPSPPLHPANPTSSSSTLPSSVAASAAPVATGAGAASAAGLDLSLDLPAGVTPVSRASTNSQERLFVACYLLAHGHASRIPVSRILDFERQLCEFLLAVPAPVEAVPASPRRFGAWPEA